MRQLLARVFVGSNRDFLEPAAGRFGATIQHLDLWSISLIARFVKIASLLAAKTLPKQPVCSKTLPTRHRCN